MAVSLLRQLVAAVRGVQVPPGKQPGGGVQSVGACGAAAPRRAGVPEQIQVPAVSHRRDVAATGNCGPDGPADVA